MGDVEIKLASQLARFAADEARFTVESGTFSDVIQQISRRHPLLARRLLDEAGGPLPFINIYVDDDNVRDLPADPQIRPGAKVMIVSAVAGG